MIVSENLRFMDVQYHPADLIFRKNSSAKDNSLST